MPKAKKLIEVALPVKEISAESVRDKYMRKGHISTLHLWWARRPLPVCRAAVFSSLVPDPLDENCSKAFKDTIEILLGAKNNSGDPYKPYEDIPYTSKIDPLEDNLRNRLITFTGHFSEKYIENEKKGDKTSSSNQISNFSLIKSESKDNKKVLEKARKLIWVAHNSRSNQDNSAEELLNQYCKARSEISKAEKSLYSTIDRHIKTNKITSKKMALENAKKNFLDKMPKVFDPFAGGGAIPLEAARLGCRAYANDLNPVAFLVQKASTKIPQKFGKPIIYSKDQFIEKYGSKMFNKMPPNTQEFENGEISGIRIKNRLSFDVEFYCKKLLDLAKQDIGKYYPRNEEGVEPAAYYWCRVAKCSNPTCQAKVPLLKRFYLSKRRTKTSKDWVYLDPNVNDNEIEFKIKNGKCNIDGWNNRGNLTCPCCGNTTAVENIRKQSRKGELSLRLLAVIYETDEGKIFSKPSEEDFKAIQNLPDWIEDKRPTEDMQPNSAGGDTFNWGITKWGQLYFDRQLLAMFTFVSKLKELRNELLPEFEEEKITYDHNKCHKYQEAVVTYLAILIDRIAMRNTMFNTWHIQQDTIEKVFGRQAIPMIFDFPEMNPFSEKFTSSAYGQIDQIIDYIEAESFSFNYAICQNATSGDKSQFKRDSLDVVVTDPPYYDAIAYADLSDFFYIWLKRSIDDIYPKTFATPQAPKTDECTALKHHHDNDIQKAKAHFEQKLSKILQTIQYQTKDLVSIMFAHQSTEAWTTLCNSILNTDLNIESSWAVETESTTGLKQDKAFLASSVTVSCRPAMKSGIGDYDSIKNSIKTRVNAEVKKLFNQGLRGADLLTACFGKAVGSFGEFENVEKADGTKVTIQELLDIARDYAFEAIISDIDADDITRFYIGWLNLFGFTEAEHDDVSRITQIGLNLDVKELTRQNILIRDGDKQILAKSLERFNSHQSLGKSPNSPLIDQVHRAMILYRNPNRNALLAFLGRHAPSEHDPFWRVVNSLAEVLPAGSADHDAVTGMITNKENLLKEAKQTDIQKPQQQDMFNEG